MEYSEEYWEKRFENSDVYPEKAKEAIKEVYSVFPEHCMPQGEADPLYMLIVFLDALGISIFDERIFDERL